MNHGVAPTRPLPEPLSRVISPLLTHCHSAAPQRFGRDVPFQTFSTCPPSSASANSYLSSRPSSSPHRQSRVPGKLTESPDSRLRCAFGAVTRLWTSVSSEKNHIHGFLVGSSLIAICGAPAPSGDRGMHCCLNPPPSLAIPFESGSGHTGTP